MQGRIYFENTPWPEGHPLKDVEFSAGLVPDGVTLALHLTSQDYGFERNIETEDEDSDPLPEFEDVEDRMHPDLWYNYHACTLSNTHWGQEGRARLDTSKGPIEISDITLNPLIFDPVKTNAKGVGDPSHKWESDGQAFHIYLLGHDAVANHHITFTEQKDGLFSWIWTGLTANAYIGETQFKHKFRCKAQDVPFLGYQCPRLEGENAKDTRTILSETEREDRHRALALRFIKNAEALSFYPRHKPNGIDWLSPLPYHPSAWPVKDRLKTQSVKE